MKSKQNNKFQTVLQYICSLPSVFHFRL